MKVIFEFNLPEEIEEHKHALKGMDYHVTIQETLEFIRRKIKYDTKVTPDQEKILEEVRSFIVESLDDIAI